MKCPHRPEPELGYMNWHLDAAERNKRGERQRQCPVCEKWIWSSFWGPVEWPTKNRFACVVQTQKRQSVKR